MRCDLLLTVGYALFDKKLRWNAYHYKHSILLPNHGTDIF